MIYNAFLQISKEAGWENTSLENQRQLHQNFQNEAGDEYCFGLCWVSRSPRVCATVAIRRGVQKSLENK